MPDEPEPGSDNPSVPPENPAPEPAPEPTAESDPWDRLTKTLDERIDAGFERWFAENQPEPDKGGPDGKSGTPIRQTPASGGGAGAGGRKANESASAPKARAAAPSPFDFLFGGLKPKAPK